MAPPARLQRSLDDEAAYDLVIRRHLGAFGPASVQDISTWGKIRVPNIRASLARVKRILPLPRYDELLIGYEYRDRVIATKHRAAVYTKNALIEAVFLVDGSVAGTWALAATRAGAVLRIRPFGTLARADRAAATGEGEALARFMAPDAKTHEARIG